MEGSKWNEIVLKLGEEKIAQLVNAVLSRSYGARCKVETSVERIVEALDLPSRREMDELREKAEELQRQLDALRGRMEETRKPAARKKGGSARPAEQQESFPEVSGE